MLAHEAAVQRKGEGQDERDDRIQDDVDRDADPRTSADALGKIAHATRPSAQQQQRGNAHADVGQSP
jgi:hypothetical protein